MFICVLQVTGGRITHREDTVTAAMVKCMNEWMSAKNEDSAKINGAETWKTNDANYYYKFM